MKLKQIKVFIVFSIITSILVTQSVIAAENIVTNEASVQTIKELFPDVNLAKAIAEVIYEDSDISATVTENQLAEVTDLIVPDSNIQDLSGIENLKNLRFLNARKNQITDISMLSNLPNLLGFVIDEQIIELPDVAVGITKPLTLLNDVNEIPYYTITEGGFLFNGLLVLNRIGEHSLTWQSSTLLGVFNGTIKQRAIAAGPVSSNGLEYDFSKQNGCHWDQFNPDDVQTCHTLRLARITDFTGTQNRVLIPSRVNYQGDYYNVRTIYHTAFQNKGLLHIEFASNTSINQIGTGAFAGNPLQSIIVPKGYAQPNGWLFMSLQSGMRGVTANTFLYEEGTESPMYQWNGIDNWVSLR